MSNRRVQFARRSDDDTNKDGAGCCASPGHCCAASCKLIFGLLGAIFAYIYIVSYFFGEANTPRVLWFSAVVCGIALIVLVLYGVASMCMNWLGDWPLTILALIAAVAVFGGLQIYLSDAIV